MKWSYLLPLVLCSGCVVVHREPRPVYVERVVYEPVPARPAEPPHVREARGALSRIDVAPCRDAGAPRGKGHAKVTFSPEGNVSNVAIDAPNGLSEPAVACIGERLSAAKIAEYNGRAVTVGTFWFIP